MTCSYWKFGLGYGHQNTAVLSECLPFLPEDLPVPDVLLPDPFCFIPGSWTLSPDVDIFVLYEPSLFFILAKVSTSGENTPDFLAVPCSLSASAVLAQPLLHQHRDNVCASCHTSICFCRLWTMSYTEVFPACV